MLMPLLVPSQRSRGTRYAFVLVRAVMLCTRVPRSELTGMHMCIVLAAVCTAVQLWLPLAKLTSSLTLYSVRHLDHLNRLKRSLFLY
jgi:hypothetical protein